MQVALAGTGVWLSDGATNVMPVAAAPRATDLTAEQEEENRARRPRRLAAPLRRHPALARATATTRAGTCTPRSSPTRYAAVYAFFLEGLEPAGERLADFVEKAAQATLVGDVFDDAATGQGLLNYFLRAINCGAITEDEVTDLTGLTVDELRTRSFLRILEGRRDR